MTYPLRCILALPTIAATPALAQVVQPAPAGTLTVAIDNVRAARGHVRIDVCSEATFLKENCPYSAAAPAVKGLTTVVVRNLPPGRYAIQAYLDENDDRRVDRALFGIPKEGIGFSRTRIRFSAPRFADAAFAFPGGEQAIRLSLQYFL